MAAMNAALLRWGESATICSEWGTIFAGAFGKSEGRL
jgi:hypothetical protein